VQETSRPYRAALPKIAPSVVPSTAGRRLTKSALQQTQICGLEELGFPYPADACEGPRAVARVLAQSPAGSRRRHTVAACA